MLRTLSLQEIMLSSAQQTTTWGEGDLPIVSLSYHDHVPAGCVLGRSDGYKPWDNPGDLISHKTEFWIRSLLSSTLTPLLFIFGFPANILNAVVFYRQGLRERINLCLFILSLADLVAITVQFLLNIEVAYRNLFNVESNFFLQYLVGLTGFMWVSQFLTCVIACERCFCVFSPLKAQKYLKTSTMAWVILVTSVFLVGGITLTAGFAFTFTCVFDPVTNQTSKAQTFTNFYLDNKFAFQIIDVLIYSVLFTIVLLFVMIITTVLTIIKLYQAARWRQQNGAVSVKTSSETTEATKGPSQLSSKEEAITKMLVVASILFIVCLSPVVMVQISVFAVSELSYSGRYYNTISVLWEIINQLRMVSCSLNFIIYCRMGSRFRSTLREILRFKYD